MIVELIVLVIWSVAAGMWFNTIGDCMADSNRSNVLPTILFILSMFMVAFHGIRIGMELV